MFMVEYYTVYLMFCLAKCIHVNVVSVKFFVQHSELNSH